MKLNPFCMCCAMNKQEKEIRHFKDEEKKVTYMKEVCRRFSQAGENDCAPSISVELSKYYSEFWNVPEKDYTEIKKEFNSLMMGLEDSLRAIIDESPDPLEAALNYARIGNYIDFAAMEHVSKDKVLSMIKSEKKEPLDEAEYVRFKEEMANARSLVYLTDNCGEIVLDKLAIEVLKKLYPNTEITVIVRGEPVVNDATMEDARMCGLTDLVTVQGNGSNVGGTWLPGIDKATRSLLDTADVILAKGQGNFETLHDCGLNVYYLFLCKCQRFVELFHVPLFKGMFVNEHRIPDSWK